MTLFASTLRRLCGPVNIAPPGEDAVEVARKLGCHPNSLAHGRRSGRFEVRGIQNLGGKWGKPVPVLYSPNTFDPCARSSRRPDPIWGSMWTQLPDQLPDDFEQSLVREPEYRRVPRAPRGRLRHTYYHRFVGWRWRCPGCRRRVMTIYLPIPPINIPTFFGLEKHRRELDAIPTPPQCFACAICHRIQHFTRLRAKEWNHLVAHLSGGLLYGHEVERPAWFTKDRQRPFHPHVLRAPSPRRQEVLERLLKGWSRNQIAKDLGIAPRTVKNHAHTIYAQARVPNRLALAKRHGITLQPRRPRRDQVRELRAAGKNVKEIAREMGITTARVYQHLAEIRRETRGRLVKSTLAKQRSKVAVPADDSDDL